jgi:hypothetical protein
MLMRKREVLVWVALDEEEEPEAMDAISCDYEGIHMGLPWR